MSRMVAWGFDNRSAGEFTSIFPHGSMVDGSYSTSGGGQSTVVIPPSGASLANIGRYVTATHAKLGLAAGMFDTPWSVRVPASATIYNVAYALSLRAPDYPVLLSGTVHQIAAQMIELLNAQEEMFVRPGVFGGVDIVRQETLDQRSFWEQLTALVARAGKEMLVRPAVEDKQLIIYIDIVDQVGVDTGFLLHDGKGANMQLVDATVDGKIINRKIGIGNQSSDSGRVQTQPQVNADSQGAFRLRGDATQYQSNDDDTLLKNTQADLAYSAWPKFRFKINILDVGEAFYHARPGNRVLVHITKGLQLPGGAVSWRGLARMMALAYDEASETVSSTMEAFYYGNATVQ